MLVAGSLAVAFLLSTSRWGAYLRVGPIFVTDMLVALAGVQLAMRAITRREREERTGRRASPGIFAGTLLAYSVARLLITAGPYSDALRDFAPYGYIVLAFVSAWSWAHIDPAAESRTATLLRWALYAHLAWAIVSFGFPDFVADLPVIPGSPGVNVLRLRNDFDGMLIGVAGALALYRAWLRSGHRWEWLIAVTSPVLVSQLDNRAALISLLASYAAVLGIAILIANDASRRRRLAAVLLLAPVVAAVALALLPSSIAGGKLLSSIGATTPRTATEKVGLGLRRPVVKRGPRLPTTHVRPQRAPHSELVLGPTSCAIPPRTFSCSGTLDRMCAPHTTSQSERTHAWACSVFRSPLALSSQHASHFGADDVTSQETRPTRTPRSSSSLPFPSRCSVWCWSLRLARSPSSGP